MLWAPQGEMKLDQLSSIAKQTIQQSLGAQVAGEETTAAAGGGETWGAAAGAGAGAGAMTGGGVAMDEATLDAADVADLAEACEAPVAA